MTGELEAESAASLYVFTGSAGDVVDVTLEPTGDLDAIIYLVDVDGNIVDQADAGFAGDAEILIDVALPIGGDVYIVVEDFEPGTATDVGFTLTLDVQ